MCLLVESICLENGKLKNISYHNKRFNLSRKNLFGIDEKVDLNNIIKIPEDIDSSVYKVRVIYSRKIEKIEFEKYVFRKRETLRVIFSDDIDYSYKYLDREKLEELFKLRKECDDILIVKNKHVTDTFASNIIFFDGNKYLTPAYPLLKGTKRQFLIDNGAILEDEILVKDLKHFKGFKLINAMLDFDENMLPIDNIKGYL